MVFKSHLIHLCPQAKDRQLSVHRGVEREPSSLPQSWLQKAFSGPERLQHCQLAKSSTDRTVLLPLRRLHGVEVAPVGGSAAVFCHVPLLGSACHVTRHQGPVGCVEEHVVPVGVIGLCCRVAVM